MFPEATSTNGTTIIPFKRGAFMSMRKVVPMTFTIEQRFGGFVPTFNGVNVYNLFAMWLSSLSLTKFTIHYMPEFEPNDFMLERFKSAKDASPWSIYANCVRDAISKYSGLPMVQNNLL